MKTFLAYLFITLSMIFVVIILYGEFDYARHMDNQDTKVYFHEGH
jgi:hypothetical protein